MRRAFLIVALMMAGCEPGADTEAPGGPPGDPMTGGPTAPGTDPGMMPTPMPPAAIPQPLHVDFQPAGMDAAAGYLPDVGDAFGDRGSGLSYGWSAAVGDRARYVEPPFEGLDVKGWTAVEMAADRAATWEVAVPNGAYSVSVVAGGPSATTVQLVAAEGVPVVQGAPTEYAPWIKGVATISVTDGRLTLTNMTAVDGTWLCYLDIAPDIRNVEWLHRN